jgi:ribosomal protein S18 acetylase RimI-like enzyme
MIQPIDIRPSRPEDADLLARLIHLTMGIEADWLFGRGKDHPALQVISELSRYPENRVSHTLAHLAERNGQAVGLLLSYPGAQLTRLNLMTGWHLLKTQGLLATLRLAGIQPAYGNLKECAGDEYYVSNLAVLPDFEGQGIGTRMMAYAEELALSTGLQKCSLIVAFNHEHARKLYERLGYKITRTVLSGHPKIAEGSGGYHRMVKNLVPVPG